MGGNLRQVKRRDIDPQRWDAAVMSDAHPLPYGLHWWLDTVTDGRWDGLVLDDYRAVFPLPRLKRLKVLPTTIRPPYTQQMGPYGQLRDGEATELLRAIPHSFQTVLTLRPHLREAEVPPRYGTRRRINYVVDLSRPFDEVVMGFPKTLRAYLRKTSDDQLEVMESGPFVDLCRERLGDRAGIKVSQFRLLRGLVDAASQRDCGGCFQLTEDGAVARGRLLPHPGRSYHQHCPGIHGAWT